MTNPISIIPRLRIAVCVITATAIWLSSCSHRDSNAAVPKPEAWPRIEIPAEQFTDHTFGNACLPLNSAAQVSEQRKDDGTWIDVTYPTFLNARLYLTLLTTANPEDLKTVLDNRRERMELNTGGAVTELTELTSEGGWDALLAVTRSSMTTPVQFVANDGKNVLSGVLYLNFPTGTPADSVAPIVKTVRRDMLHALKHLRNG